MPRKKSSNINIKINNLDKLIEEGKKKDKWKRGAGHCGAVYGLGFVGAAIYFISTATSFWMGALGILKALVWPAYLVYYLLQFLGA